MERGGSVRRVAANVETVHEKAKELFCRSLEHKQKRSSKRLNERIKRRRDSATLCSSTVAMFDKQLQEFNVASSSDDAFEQKLSSLEQTVGLSRRNSKGRGRRRRPRYSSSEASSSVTSELDAVEINESWKAGGIEDEDEDDPSSHLSDFGRRAIMKVYKQVQQNRHHRRK